MKIGILFDLDGTLLDTLKDILAATNYALSVHGYPSRTLAELRRFVGNGAENQIRLSLPARASPEEVQTVLATYKPYYTAHCQHFTRPYEGIPQALAQISRKYPLAIVSNKPDAAVKALCAREFPGIFALGESPDCPRKPDPAMVRKALAAIGADTCVFVGDSEVDLLTAKNAGVPCLSVLWGFRDREDLEKAGAHRFCQDPAELPQALDGLILSAL